MLVPAPRGAGGTSAGTITAVPARQPARHDATAVASVASSPPLAANAAQPASANAAPAADPASVVVETSAAEEQGPPDITWAGSFDSRSGGLDETARLRLIGDLGVVAKEWCVPLLCLAYEQERRPAHRQAALTALAACRSRTAIPTFEAAQTGDDPAAQAIAADALADLQPPPPVRRRRTVERF
jgi:hypothetical protein